MRTVTATLFVVLVGCLLVAARGDAIAQTSPATDRLSDPREKADNDRLPPGALMDALGIRPGSFVGEVMAGRGRLTVHLADRVGATGRVWAHDTNQEALTELGARSRSLGLPNVETIVGASTDARLPFNRLDIVLMVWVHRVNPKPVALLASLIPSLKPWGAVVVVEPTGDGGQASGSAVAREQIVAEAEAAGFAVEGEIVGRLAHDRIYVLRPVAPTASDPETTRALWREYVAWTRTAKGGTSPRDYAVQLDRDGLPAAEVRRRMQIVRSQFTEQPEGIAMIYDASYGKPLTGDPAKDGFKTAPNTFLVEAAGQIPVGGTALDVGAGMGRNAVHLAKLGWQVTAIDLSGEGLKVTEANAAKVGRKVTTVRTSYQDYDFGVARWDLVAMILSWAPIEEPAFLARLKASVKPGGHVVFESNLQRAENPFPPGVHAPTPGLLRELFKDFEILVYREVDDFGDWGGPPIAHVRMIARKR